MTCRGTPGGNCGYLWPALKNQNIDDQQLKLNNDKTELITMTTSETTSRQENIVINIGDSPLHQVWNHPGTLVSCLIQPVVVIII